MAWTNPKQFTEGERLTARDLNLYLRDNLMENEVMKATTEGARLSTNLAGELVERKISYNEIETSETALSNHYPPSGGTFIGPTNLGNIGPSVSVETGTRAIIFFSARIKSNDPSIDTTSGVGIDIVSDATQRLIELHPNNGPTNRVSTFNVIKSASPSVSTMILVENLTPGINTFTMRYFLPIPWIDYSIDEFVGEFKETQATYSNRHLLVIPL